MTLKELKTLLETFPEELTVIVPQFSEYVLLDADDILIVRHCTHRPDGWIHEYREDKPTQEYLQIGF